MAKVEPCTLLAYLGAQPELLWATRKGAVVPYCNNSITLPTIAHIQVPGLRKAHGVRRKQGILLPLRPINYHKISMATVKSESDCGTVLATLVLI